MKQNPSDIKETIDLPEGLAVDMDEGWPKLVSRQFGGDPGRAFNELIQNLLDSYPQDTPWEERSGEIKTSERGISITDYGEGIDRDRIRLLLTLGGTDKWDDPEKIGKFGIGFFSIFNPGLGTREVVVTTRCEGSVVELTFTVLDPEKRPEISCKILDRPTRFSTQIEIRFDQKCSARSCLSHARNALKYYPCRVSVNGDLLKSVWDQAEEEGAVNFNEGACRGFLEETASGGRITVLCRYEHIVDLTVRGFITGGHNMTLDLRDFAAKEVPFLPGVGATINSMTLRVTIGRDGFYLEAPYHEMVRALACRLLLELGKRIRANPDPGLILANQYVLRKRIRDYLAKGKIRKGRDRKNSEEGVLQFLAESKIYRLNGKKKRYSLVQLKGLLSPGLPFYYSPGQTHLRWLGGAFRHDFIVLPPPAHTGGGAPDFFETLFGTFFEETINLDTIQADREKIQDLVSRGIADESALAPEIRIKGQRELSEEERRLLREMDGILAQEGVRLAIADHLHLNAASVRSAFFEINESGATISSGIFSRDGKALSKEMVTNFIRKDKDAAIAHAAQSGVELLVGLNAENPLMEALIPNNDPHRAYYALTLLAHELTKCQHMLTPQTPFYHVVKDRLANDMRKAMMERLLVEGETSERPNIHHRTSKQPASGTDN
jgi:hypothetical protein